MLLDFGTGIARLLDYEKHLLNDVSRIIGIISHYHADHVAGLIYTPALKIPHLELFAPGKDIYAKSAHEILENIFSAPFSPRPLDKFIPSVEIHDIPLEGATLDGIEFSFRVQHNHVHPTVAVRIGEHLTYCTDTEPEFETIQFAKDSGLLLHECWYDAEIPLQAIESNQVEGVLKQKSGVGHSSNLAVALITREAGVQKALTIHHNPIVSKNEIHKMAQLAAEFAGVDLSPAEDGIPVNC